MNYLGQPYDRLPVWCLANTVWPFAPPFQQSMYFVYRCIAANHTCCNAVDAIYCSASELSRCGQIVTMQ